MGNHVASRTIISNKNKGQWHLSDSQRFPGSGLHQPIFKSAFFKLPCNIHIKRNICWYICGFYLGFTLMHICLKSIFPISLSPLNKYIIKDNWKLELDLMRHTGNKWFITHNCVSHRYVCVCVCMIRSSHYS